MSGNASNITIFCDFNGTITDVDMLHVLATACAGPEAAKRFNEGAEQGVSLRERLAAQAARVNYSLEEAEAIVERMVHFDDTFVAFYHACVDRGMKCTILSSGITALIERYLGRRGLRDLDIAANAAEFRTDGWRLIFRDASPQGNSKYDCLAKARDLGRWTVLIGDDESDFEAAEIAGRRFAKRGSPLERYLAQRSLDRDVFSRFSEIDLDALV